MWILLCEKYKQGADKKISISPLPLTKSFICFLSHVGLPKTVVFNILSLPNFHIIHTSKSQCYQHSITPRRQIYISKRAKPSFRSTVTVININKAKYRRKINHWLKLKENKTKKQPNKKHIWKQNTLKT